MPFIIYGMENVHSSFMYMHFSSSFFFQDRVTLCILCWPEICYIGQTGLELNRDLPASASGVLELKILATIPGPAQAIVIYIHGYP